MNEPCANEAALAKNKLRRTGGRGELKDRISLPLHKHRQKCRVWSGC